MQSAALVLDRREDGGRSVSAVDETPAHHNATEMRLLPMRMDSINKIDDIEHLSLSRPGFRRGCGSGR
jgi:hypothetical protein